MSADRDFPTKPHGRRRARRKGRATKDAERRALAKANAKPARPPRGPLPGFAVLHVDGGARGAPGPAAIGYLLQDEEGVRIAEHAEATGTTRAAEAEYRALLAGLTRAHELGLRRLIELEADITDMRMRIGTVLFEWIPAAANGEVHRLVAQALESPQK